MPQMAPMNWMFLFIMFFTILLMFNMINYFLFNYNVKLLNNNYNYQIKHKNWKW